MLDNLAPANSAKRMGHQRTPSSSDLQQFHHMTKQDAELRLESALNKLLHTAPPGSKDSFENEFTGFRRLFSRFVRARHGAQIEWDRIQDLPEGSVRPYDQLEQPTDTEKVRELLNKLVVVKLNGGLGTSMGCQGPKSTIPVRSDLTFLDLTVQQIEALNNKYQADVPLVLMNSFNTNEDTEKVVGKYSNLNCKIYTFLQSRYPRIDKESLMPIPSSLDLGQNLDAWYPPGHGDFYPSFCNSGLLDKFINEGKEYCFISNIDNLGATVDLGILNFLFNGPSGDKRPEFVMEVTDKTRADVKGGTLMCYEEKLRLLEIAQVPKENVDDFKSVKKFKIFNTNNLWINLPAIQRVCRQSELELEVIVNPKTLESGQNVIQLETAVGAAMKNFEGGIGINVPRSRFLPVKKTSDFLLVMSNLYSLKSGFLEMSPKRMFLSTPLIKLGTHFDKVRDFLRRFEKIPDIIELDHLTVSGDVNFGRNVTLRGTVIIIANHGDRIDIPPGAILENKIVSGNLRILDH